MTMSLPDGRPSVVALRTAAAGHVIGHRAGHVTDLAGSGGAAGWTGRSDGLWPAGPADRLAARLAIGAATHVAAKALRPSVPAEAYNEEF